MLQQSIVLIDAAGRRRSPASMPGFLAGRAPHNKGMQYPPDPPRTEGISLVMRRAGEGRHGLRIRALIAVQAGARRQLAPHQLRHAHAVGLAREGVAVNIIQRQLGHSDLGTTSTYLQGIDPSEIIDAVRLRRQPTIPAATASNSTGFAAARIDPETGTIVWPGGADLAPTPSTSGSAPVFGQTNTPRPSSDPGQGPVAAWAAGSKLRGPQHCSV